MNAAMNNTNAIRDKSNIRQLSAGGIQFGVLTETQDAPLNYFLHSYGPASTPTLYLGWVLTTILVAIFIIISLLLVWALFRKRPEKDRHFIDREDGG